MLKYRVDGQRRHEPMPGSDYTIMTMFYFMYIDNNVFVLFTFSLIKVQSLSYC